MADQSTTYRATRRPAEELTEEGRRWNHKLTAKVDTRGVRWAVEVSLEGQPRSLLAGEDACSAEVTILRLEPSEQPLTGLYEALTRELHVDEMAAAVRLTTDVEVRAMNAKGRPSKRFEPLFPGVLVYVRSLRGAQIRAPNGSLPGMVRNLAMNAPPVRPGVALKREAWRGREEHLEVQRKAHWFGDVMKPSQDALREIAIKAPNGASNGEGRLAAAEDEAAGGDR